MALASNFISDCGLYSIHSAMLKHVARHTGQGLNVRSSLGYSYNEEQQWTGSRYMLIALLDIVLMPPSHCHSLQHVHRHGAAVARHLAIILHTSSDLYY
eukprot:16126-Heterococcus_DN1.PRE.3